MFIVAITWLTTKTMCMHHVAIPRPQLVNVVHFNILLACFEGPIFPFLLLPTALRFDVRVI
jgi:hypothetical protein